jgi:uncharacterized phage-associated protein
MVWASAHEQPTERIENAKGTARGTPSSRRNRRSRNGCADSNRRDSRQSEIGPREKRACGCGGTCKKIGPHKAKRDCQEGGGGEVVMNAHAGEFRADKPRLNFKPQYEKILELLVYLAHKRPGADQYQAVKLFYLSDREHFNRNGRPITFETYYALDYGPVASTALDLIKERRVTMKRVGIEALPIRTEKRDRIIVLAEPLRAVDYEVFSKSDLRVFDQVIEEHGNKSFDELYKLTHAHFAYDIAWKNRGDARHAPMYYEDMLDEGPRKAAILEALEPIAEHVR